MNFLNISSRVVLCSAHERDRLGSVYTYGATAGIVTKMIDRFTQCGYKTWRRVLLNEYFILLKEGVLFAV